MMHKITAMLANTDTSNFEVIEFIVCLLSFVATLQDQTTILCD